MPPNILPGDETIVETEFIRIPVSGPKPWNTLAFIRCRAAGIAYDSGPFYWYRIRFKSTFQIVEFNQSKLKWYKENTFISATCTLMQMSHDTDLAFIEAVEAISGYVADDGRIAFDVQQALQASSGGGFSAREVSAYVLLYEPRDEPSPTVPPTKPGRMPKIEVLPSQFGRRRDFRITADASILRKPPDD